VNLLEITLKVILAAIGLSYLVVLLLGATAAMETLERQKRRRDGRKPKPSDAYVVGVDPAVKEDEKAGA
jgi:hypothetical protein